MSTIAFALTTFLHDLFTAVWIGGLIAVGITTLPSAKKVLGKGPQTRQLVDTIQKRQSVLVYVCIIGLVLTGLIQARYTPAFQGLFSFGNTYSAVLGLKHLLVLGMIVVALYRSLVLGRRNRPLAPFEEKMSATLLILNFFLGVTILLLSGFSAALSSGPLTV